MYQLNVLYHEYSFIQEIHKIYRFIVKFEMLMLL